MTTHARRVDPAVGPTVDLVALPTRKHLGPRSPVAEIIAYLGRVEEARSRQLAALPALERDPVAAAHRSAVEAILNDVRTARRRAEAGLYGVCVVCDGAIDLRRLELRPWATACATHAC